MQKCSLNRIFILGIFLHNVFVNSNTCFEDNFEGGQLGLLTEECNGPNYKPLMIKDYSDSDDFEKPVNSTKYLSSYGPNFSSCLINNNIKIMKGTSLVFRMISYFDGNGITPLCFVDVNEVGTGEWVASDQRTFKNSKEWEDWLFVITKEAEAVIRVSCSSVNGGSILAIDYIKISAESDDDCSIIIPTTTTTEETTTSSSTTSTTTLSTTVETTTSSTSVTSTSTSETSPSTTSTSTTPISSSTTKLPPTVDYDDLMRRRAIAIASIAFIIVNLIWLTAVSIYLIRRPSNVVKNSKKSSITTRESTISDSVLSIPRLEIKKTYINENDVIIDISSKSK